MAKFIQTIGGIILFLLIIRFVGELVTGDTGRSPSVEAAAEADTESHNAQVDVYQPKLELESNPYIRAIYKISIMCAYVKCSDYKTPLLTTNPTDCINFVMNLNETNNNSYWHYQCLVAMVPYDLWKIVDNGGIVNPTIIESLNWTLVSE